MNIYLDSAPFTDWFSRLTEPSSRLREPEQRQDARLLSALLLAFIGFTLVTPLLQLLRPMESEPALLLIIAVSNLTLLVQYFLSRSGYIIVACWFFILGLFTVVLAAITVFHTVQPAYVPTTLVYLVLAVLAASLVFPVRVTLVVALLVIFTTGGIMFAVEEGDIFAMGILHINALLCGVLLVAGWVRRQQQTQIRQQAAALADEHNLLRTVLESVPDAIYVKDLESRFRLGNHKIAGWFGLSENSLIGKSDLELFNYAFWQRTRAQEKELMETGVPIVNLERRLTNPDGSTHWVLVTKVPLHDKEGRIIGLVGINHNIDERKQAELALEQERNLLRTVIDSLPDPVYVKDRESRFVLVNQRVLLDHEIVREEELVGKTDLDIVGEHAWQLTYPEDQQIMSTGLPVVNLQRSRKKNGKETNWWLTTKVPLRDPQGEIVGLVGIDRDVTALKKTEFRLASERNLLRTVIDALPDQVYVKDRESRIVLINRRALEEQAIEHEDQILGKNDLELIGETAWKCTRPEDLEVMNSGLPLFNVERSWPDKQGEAGWWLITKAPLYDNEGQVIGIVGIDRNITARKHTEIMLARERNLLQAIMDNAPDQIYVKDMDRRFLLVNKAILNRYDFTSPDQIIGKRDADLFDEEFDHFTRALETPILERGETFLNYETHYFKDGQIHWILITKVPLRDPEGRITGLIGINRDVTERKHIEEKLREEHNLLQTILESVPDPVYVKDRESRFMMVNRVIVEGLGLGSTEEIIGKTDFDLMSQDAALNHYEAEQSLMRSGHAIINQETVSQDSQNPEVVYLITKVPLRNPQGEIIGLVGVNRDITDRKRAENTLARERNLLLTLIDSMPEWVYVKDRDLRFILANRVTRDIIAEMGVTDLIGKTDADIFNAEEARRYYEEEQRVVETGIPLINREAEGTLPDGRHVYLLVTKVPVFDERGQVSFVVGMNHDITEYKSAQDALHTERNLLRTLIDSMPDAIYIKDAGLRFLLANRATWERFGFRSADELIGKTDADLFPPERAHPLLAEERLILESGIPVLNREGSTPDHDGSPHIALITKVPIYDMEGHISGLVGINHDITELRRAEIQLRYQASLLENLTDAVISTDMHFNIISWNIGAEELYGWRAEEVMGQQMQTVVPVSNNEILPQNMVDELLSVGYWRGEIEQQAKDGTIKCVWGSVSLVRDGDGKPVGVVAINHDITERKHAEQQEMELALERARVNILRRFIGDMSHDLRNPLATIKVSLYLLRKLLDNPERRLHHLEVLDSHVLRLETMVDDLLSMSHLDQPTDEFKFGLGDVETLVTEVVQQQQPLAARRGQQLTLEADIKLPEIACDPLKLNRAITNLVINALNYTPPDGQVQVRLYKNGPYLCVAVTDNGIGIAATDLPHIFDRFYRADKARRTDTGGTGLGLSIAQRIVQAHGGKINVTSTLGRGSTFTIMLPLVVEVSH